MNMWYVEKGIFEAFNYMVWGDDNNINSVYYSPQKEVVGIPSVVTITHIIQEGELLVVGGFHISISKNTFLMSWKSVIYVQHHWLGGT